MSDLHICLFGGFQIAHHADVTPDAKISRSAKALLAYLLLYRDRIHPRETLAVTNNERAKFSFPIECEMELEQIEYLKYVVALPHINNRICRLTEPIETN